MARNMSFMLTTQQVLAQTKDVTRRVGWWNLKPGDQLNAVEKGMGLKRGQKIVKLGRIEVVSIRHERLDEITPADVIALRDWGGWSNINMPARYVKRNAIANDGVSWRRDDA